MVSSRIRGLEVERRAIKDALENDTTYPNLFEVHLSEDWTSDARSSAELCYTLARECDFFILLLGTYYGKPPKGQTRSVTEEEFHIARASNPHKVRAYLKSVGTVEPKQKQFIQRVRDFSAGVQCPEFRNLADLQRMVIKDALAYRDQFVSQLGLSSTRPGLSYTSPSEPVPRQHQLLELSSGSDEDTKPTKTARQQLLDLQREYVRRVIRAEGPVQLAERLVSDMPPEDLRILAVVAHGNILARKAYLTVLFPKEQWVTFLRRMAHRGVLRLTAGVLRVADNVQNYLAHDQAITREAHERWVSVLEPNAGYSDLGFSLCLHLQALNRVPEAIEHAHDMIASHVDHVFAGLFYRFIDHVRSSATYRQLSLHLRIVVLNATGLFYLHDGKPDKALRTFNAMLKASQQAHDDWGIRQALLHRGVTWVQLGNRSRAADCYKQALVQARKDKDLRLVGRTLFNLSQVQVSDDPQLAARTLEQSIRYKRQAGDETALFAAYNGRGVIAGTIGDHKAALHWFRKAERTARTQGSFYEQAHALHNVALSLAHIGHLTAAVTTSQQARQLAEMLGQTSLYVLTIQGEASHRYHAGDYRGALPLLLQLHKLRSAEGNTLDAIVALSDAGVCELHLKQYRNAQQHLRRAIALAKSAAGRHWLVSSIRNYVAILKAEKRHNEASLYLKREFSWARKIKEWDIAAELGATRSQLLTELNAPADTIDKSWLQTIDAARNGENPLTQLRLYKQRYLWLRETQPSQVAASALHPLLRFLQGRKALRKEYITALDEMGSRLMEQEQYEKAEQYYRRALKLVNTQPAREKPSQLFNNYGELYRRTGRATEAIPLYRQAILVDQRNGDIGAVLLTKHNLALALDDIGRTSAATALLKEIQKASRTKGLWENYVKTWLALGDSAWPHGQLKLALHRYETARALCARYDLSVLSLHVALNEAQLQLHMNRGDLALSLLRPLRKHFLSSEHAFQLFLTLGRCLVEQQKYKEAISVLEDGLRCPQAAYSPADVTSLWTTLISARVGARQVITVRPQLKQLLPAHLSPQERHERLTQLLLTLGKVELRKEGEPHHTEEVLKEIENHAQAHKQWVWIRDSYEALGMTLWDTNRKAAIQIYVAGMLKISENDTLHGFIHLGAHLLAKLHQLGLLRGKKEIVSLRQETQDWLLQQMKKESPTTNDQTTPVVLRWLMWPFDLTLKVLSRPDKGRKLKTEETGHILQEYFSSARVSESEPSDHPFCRARALG